MQTDSHGKPVLGSPDGNVLARELDELNKVCERIEKDLLVSEEKANFKVDIDRTMMVIDQVLKPKGYHSNTTMVINQILKPEGSSSKGTLDWNSDRRAKYFRGLVGICRVGLEHEDPSQLTLARKSLESFREEFVAN